MTLARMIPPIIPTACPSLGELEIFNHLKKDVATNDWIAVHSLDIAQHIRQVSGEADFIIIVPSLGVLCLEVKACHSLRRESGVWFYGRNPNGDPRGPFKQAAEAMHSLRQRVIKREPSLSRVLFWSAVMFPFIEFNIASGEWHPWQVIDSRQFKKQPISTLISNVLRNARAHLRAQQSIRWFHDPDRLPNIQQTAAITKILRPNFEFTENHSDRHLRQQTEIIRYTEEQFLALDTMEDNPRVLFTGPAGTGKTVLALEAARRAANVGKNVLLVCFNRLLGQWLSRSLLAQSDHVTVGTFHQYLMGIVGIKTTGNAGSSFWCSELPEAAISRLLNDHNDIGRFDIVIVDEAQDLLQPLYLDVMELVLKDGLINGSWRMFGDFERQMIYGQDRDRTDELLRKRLSTYARGSLRVNCRNTPRIAALSHLLGGLDPNYSRILRPDDQIDPIISYYATPSQQRKEVARALDLLLKESFNPDDIVVLSPKSEPRCVAASITDKLLSEQLAPFEKAATGQIRYTTIQKFKGLDSSAIIVTDIEHIDDDMFSSLFYIASTRALERLHIIVHETAKTGIIQALLGNK